MYNFIIDEFENSKPPRKEEGKKQHSLEGKRRKSIITIFEQSGGLIGPEEIADALDIDLELVKRILGVRRIEQYEILVGKKKPTIPKRDRRKKVNPSEEKEEEKLDRIIIERNKEIFELSTQGMSLAEIHERTGMSIDLLKEIYMSLGLNIYTDEEIEEMRRQAESVSQNPKTVIAPETTEKSASGVKGEIKADSKKMERAAIDLQEGGKTEEYGEREVDSEKVSSKGDVDEQENGEEGNSKSKEQELEELKAKITSYGDIGKMIKGFIAEGRIEDAIKYGKYFMNNSDFLTKIEKDNLFVLIEYMKSIKTQHFQPRCMREISDEEEMR